MLIDISPPLRAGMPVWPGDVGLQRELTADRRKGDIVTSSALRTTVHLGAHADAPSHYGPDAASIDQCDLATYIGPCEVIRVRVPRGGAVTPALLPAAPRAARVLIATDTFTDRTCFVEDFAALSTDLVDTLADAGVKLVGIDTPSVDRFVDQDLPVHQRILARELLILENLVLTEVPAGMYELIALPLKLVGFDASPVRAILRRAT